MGLTFDQLKKRIGKNIKYYDDTTGWKTGRDVTEADIGDFINEIYTEELFPMYAAQYPHIFRQVGYMNSWIATGTVSASSTGTTLVVTGLFTNGMVGLTVYNETDDEFAVIESYTDANTVTLDTTIGDTWDGDTVYVLGDKFTFGGDGTDLFTIESISIKYVSTNTRYVTADLRDMEDVLVDGNEIGYESRPYAYLTSIKTSTGLKSGFGIFPGFTKNEKVTRGIMITYVARPPVLSSSADIAILPIDASLISGGTMRAFEKMQEMSKANYWGGKYQLAQKRDLSRFRPQTSNRPVQIKLNRNVSYIHRRLI